MSGSRIDGSKQVLARAVLMARATGALSLMAWRQRGHGARWGGESRIALRPCGAGGGVSSRSASIRFDTGGSMMLCQESRESAQFSTSVDAVGSSTGSSSGFLRKMMKRMAVGAVRNRVLCGFASSLWARSLRPWGASASMARGARQENEDLPLRGYWAGADRPTPWIGGLRPCPRRSWLNRSITRPKKGASRRCWRRSRRRSKPMSKHSWDRGGSTRRTSRPSSGQCTVKRSPPRPGS